MKSLDIQILQIAKYQNNKQLFLEIDHVLDLVSQSLS